MTDLSPGSGTQDLRFGFEKYVSLALYPSSTSESLTTKEADTSHGKEPTATSPSRHVSQTPGVRKRICTGVINS